MRTMAGVAVSLWLGVMGGFAFIVAPAAFATLEREAAGRLVGAIFPRYYLVGVILGGLALVGLVGHWQGAGSRAWDWLGSGLVIVMVALTLYAWLVVLPAAHAAREAMRQAPAASAQAEGQGFARLHRLSTILNGVVMLAGIGFLALDAARRT